MTTRLLMLASLLATFTATAEQQSVDERRDAVADGTVRINVVRGDITIEGWNKNTVEVVGKLDEEVEKFIFDVDGDETTIEVKIPKSHGGWDRHEETELEIKVPNKSQVEVSGVSTDVDISETVGNIDVGVVSGDVNVDGGNERIVLQSVSGDLELRDAAGRIKLNTVSGDIESYRSTGDSSYGSVSGDVLVDAGGKDLSIESVSGDIEVLRTKIVSLSGHSVSGEVELRGELSSGGNIDFDSVSGSIRLRLEGDIDARFDLETGSGSIRNRLTSDKARASKYVRDETLRFTMGKGAGEIIFSTRSGDITLSGD